MCRAIGSVLMRLERHAAEAGRAMVDVLRHFELGTIRSGFLKFGTTYYDGRKNECALLHQFEVPLPSLLDN